MSNPGNPTAPKPTPLLLLHTFTVQLEVFTTQFVGFSITGHPQSFPVLQPAVSDSVGSHVQFGTLTQLLFEETRQLGVLFLHLSFEHPVTSIPP